MKPVLARILLPMLIAAMPSWSRADSAAGVSYSAPRNLPFVAGAHGSALADGNHVRLGYFDDGYSPASHVSDLVSLDAAWNSYAETTIRAIGGQAGRFGASAETTDPDFNGKKIYLWIFETQEAGAPNNDFSNVCAHGLFSASAWLFPATCSLPTHSTIAINTAGVTESLHAIMGSDQLTLQSLGSGVASQTYVSWAESAFPPGTSDAHKAFDVDIEGDSISNLEEFYYGLDPGVLDVHPIEMEVGDAGITFTFTRRINVSDVTVTLEASSDNARWIPITPASESITALVAELERVSWTIILESSLQRQFFRLALDQ